jgi:Fur family ferric uptake transcriptional regulator
MSESVTDSQLRECLRLAGLRSTSARLAVLRLLMDRSAPSSHPEVTHALSDGGWDRVTLYRNLMDLAEVGILRRVDLGDHVWRYELATGSHDPSSPSDHPHFLCTRCGDVACMPVLELPAGQGVPSAVLSGEVSIQFRGVCDSCAD